VGITSKPRTRSSSKLAVGLVLEIDGMRDSLTIFGAKPTKRAGQFVGKRYRLEGLLGSGASANVYLAVDTRSGKQVVVKQLTQHGNRNDEIRRRFLGEAEGLVALRHPGIVRVFDYAVPSDERPFLVMEALVGETLLSLLKRHQVLPTDIALGIARHTAQGLAAAHRAGLIHRDIKPENLFLLGPLGEPFAVKLIDFGLAKLPQSNGTSGMHTVLGTVEYMAPEQVMADPVDGRTDIYGFGILLFRLFTGHLPFEAPDGLDLLSHQLFSAVPPASWIHDGLEPRIDAIIGRATRKHPANRYPNLDALLADLDVVFGLRHDELMSSSLVVEPDVYEPQNILGRKLAAMLAQRYRSVAPAHHNHSEPPPTFERLRYPTRPVADPAQRDESSEDDFELSEG
jgi:eukaryotic-like serine/threonine-protein kinase